jgi:hypothetical protein
VKPDVVFEGGNVARQKQGQISFEIPDLHLLSTHYQPIHRPFTLTWGTSAATAQVARMAAIIAADYPQLWPEAVRALVVHSARWTPAMQAHLRGAGPKKRVRSRFVRRYGFGVPDIQRAVRSANDSLTLIVQGTIRPFSQGRMGEIHLHELPWPRDVLADLGQTSAQLRVTLSYFVEPYPGRRGWKGRYRYASHGLRFEVKGATETVDQFRKRLNSRALDEDERKPSAGSDASEWYLGEQARNHGSLHVDIWKGTAADLADRGIIGIFPVSGWWKLQPERDRSKHGVRYALVVSIETEATEADIWTPVAVEVGMPVVIAT